MHLITANPKWYWSFHPTTDPLGAPHNGCPFKCSHRLTHVSMVSRDEAAEAPVRTSCAQVHGLCSAPLTSLWLALFCQMAGTATNPYHLSACHLKREGTLVLTWMPQLLTINQQLMQEQVHRRTRRTMVGNRAPALEEETRKSLSCLA